MEWWCIECLTIINARDALVFFPQQPAGMAYPGGIRGYLEKGVHVEHAAGEWLPIRAVTMRNGEYRCEMHV